MEKKEPALLIPQYQQVYMQPQQTVHYPTQILIPNPQFQQVYAYPGYEQHPHKRGILAKAMLVHKRVRQFRKWRKILVMLFLIVKAVVIFAFYNNYTSLGELTQSIHGLKNSIREQKAKNLQRDQDFSQFENNENEDFSDSEEVESYYQAFSKKSHNPRRNLGRTEGYEDFEEDLIAPLGAPFYQLKADLAQPLLALGSITQLQDGRLATGNSINASVQFWGSSDGKLSYEFSISDNDPTIQFILQLQDGRLLTATSEYPYTLNLWNITTGALLQTVSAGDAFIVNAIQLTNGLVVGISWKQELYVWNPQSFNTPIQNLTTAKTTWPGFNPMVQMLGPYSNYIAIIVGNKNTLQVWDTTTWTLNNTITLSNIPQFINSVTGFDNAGNGSVIIATGQSYMLVLNPFTNATLQKVADPSSSDSLRGVKLLNNGYILTGGLNAQLKIWNLSTSLIIQRLSMHVVGAVTTLYALASGGFSCAAVTGLVSIYGQSQ